MIQVSGHGYKTTAFAECKCTARLVCRLRRSMPEGGRERQVGNIVARGAEHEGGHSGKHKDTAREGNGVRSNKQRRRREKGRRKGQTGLGAVTRQPERGDAQQGDMGKAMPRCTCYCTSDATRDSCLRAATTATRDILSAMCLSQKR